MLHLINTQKVADNVYCPVEDTFGELAANDYVEYCTECREADPALYTVPLAVLDWLWDKVMADDDDLLYHGEYGGQW